MAETPPFGEEPTGEPFDHDHPSAGVEGHSAPPVTPGKVAMWLFLATEVMFFTGLIGSYIVLRAGSPAGSYSNLFVPGADLTNRQDARGVVLTDAGPDPDRVVALIHEATGMPTEEVEHLVETAGSVGSTVLLVDSAYGPANVDGLQRSLDAAGATATIEGLESFSWPEPYNGLVNPLSIDLTALNTFILICSSVTMVLALAAIQRGDRVRLSLWLLATILIGSTFLGIQVYEYIQLVGPEVDATLRVTTWNVIVLATLAVLAILAIVAARRGDGNTSGMLTFLIIAGLAYEGASLFGFAESFELRLFEEVSGATGTEIANRTLAETHIGPHRLGHLYSVGVSPSGHFRPSSSLFASAFFTMTGFHGAHVTGGVIALTVLWLRSLFGGFSRANHSAIELAGLYWHFVDLVWILLFTVVYLI